MSETNLILQAMRQRLQDRARRPSSERFRELVNAGLVDKNGALAARYRGSARQATDATEVPQKK